MERCKEMERREEMPVERRGWSVSGHWPGSYYPDSRPSPDSDAYNRESAMKSGYRKDPGSDGHENKDRG